MAKYYIQTGEIQFVVTAADAEGAALWLINKTVNEFLPLNMKDNNQPIDDSFICFFVQALDQMDDEILVSEVGFGHSEVAILDTELIFKQWCQLLNAMNNLFDQL